MHHRPSSGCEYRVRGSQVTTRPNGSVAERSLREVLEPVNGAPSSLTDGTLRRVGSVCALQARTLVILLTYTSRYETAIRPAARPAIRKMLAYIAAIGYGKRSNRESKIIFLQFGRAILCRMVARRSIFLASGSSASFSLRPEQGSVQEEHRGRAEIYS